MGLAMSLLGTTLIICLTGPVTLFHKKLARILVQLELRINDYGIFYLLLGS